MDIEELKKRLLQSGCNIPIADLAYDAIESLQRENVELKHDLRQYMNAANSEATLATELQRELEEARRGAARWDEVLKHVEAASYVQRQPFVLKALQPLEDFQPMRGGIKQAFTAAIDAARNQKV